MSEIDWQRLADEHDRDPGMDSAEWLEALARFDEDPAEREQALDADPLLLFRGLPEEETGPADVEAMKLAVASMRMANDSLRRADEQAAVSWSAGSWSARVRQWPVAALVALALSVAGLTGMSFDSQEPLPTWQQAAMAEPVPAEVAQLPLVEDVGPEVGPLMQIEDDGVSLVVVISGEEMLDTIPPDNEDA